MWAAGEGHTRRGTRADRAGANVTARSKAGFTPLLFAVRNAQLDAAALLLEHGANVNDVAADGTSALERGDRQRVLRSGVGAARPRRGSERARCARLAAAHDRVAAQTGRDGAAGVGEPHGAPLPTGNVTSLELAQQLLAHGANPERPRSIGRRSRFDRSAARRAIRRARLGPSPAHVQRRDGVLRRGEERRRAADAPARRRRRRSVAHQPLRHHAADGGGGARQLGRRERRGRSRACPRRSGSKP